MNTVLASHAHGLQNDLSTASAGTSQAPSAAVDKSAPRLLRKPWSNASRTRVSN